MCVCVCHVCMCLYVNIGACSCRQAKKMSSPEAGVLGRWVSPAVA